MRQRVVRALEGEVARAVEVERDAAREVGDVELVGVPEAAPRQRRQDEEEERRDGGRHRERRPAFHAAPMRAAVGPCRRGRGARRTGSVAAGRLRGHAESALSGRQARPRDTTSKVRRGATPALLLERCFRRRPLTCARRIAPTSSRAIRPALPTPRPVRRPSRRAPAGSRSSGGPNVGKSTLLNALLGRADRHHQPPPADHARRRARRLTVGDTQFVFVDTPGLHAPRTRLGRVHERGGARQAAREADVLVLVVEAPRDGQPRRRTRPTWRWRAELPKLPTVLAINKVDLAQGQDASSCPSSPPSPRRTPSRRRSR